DQGRIRGLQAGCRKAEAQARLSPLRDENVREPSGLPFFMPRPSPSLQASQDAIDCFIDALWIEDGLSANTLAAYRRDLTLYAQWLSQAHKGSSLNDTRESDLREYAVARHAGSKATSANRRLTVFKRYFR